MQQLSEVLEWVGSGMVPTTALASLVRYADWLVEEAIPAGGLGPDEGPVVWERHVLDAVQFLKGCREGPVVDVGTGVGLPGIPLAVCRPDLEVHLLDKSGRRRALAARAARILGLDNVLVVAGDAKKDALGPFEGMVMRAALPPDDVDALVERLDVVWAVVGDGIEPHPQGGWHLDRFPGSGVLVPGRWLRMMPQP